MPQVFAEEFKSFPISAELGESLERAHRFAREQSHRLVTLEHLLLALTEDADATAMLASASVDLGRLSADVSGYLGGLLEDMRGEAHTELHPDGDLIRVLKAATTAAQQSRRRHIDGAIVLAAVVGDAKSAAAGLLKALGLTFEGAIRALQRANQPARGKVPQPNSAAHWGSGASVGKPGMAGGLEQQPPPGPGVAMPPASPEISLATSAEEFLAAARARIQQRAAAARANEPPTAVPLGAAAPSGITTGERPAPSSSAPPSNRADLNPSSLAAAIRDVAAAPAAEPAEAAPAAPAAERPPPARAVEAAPPAPSPPEARAPAESAAALAPPRPPAPAPEAAAVARLPQPGPHRGAGPLPGRPLRAGDGAPRPPLPSAPPNRPPAGFGPPLRSARTPFAANGAGAPGLPQARPPGAPRPPHDANAGIVVPLQPRGGPAGPANYAERGPLAESVPRRMRSGVAASAEVRIARDKIDSLMLALCNRGVRPEAYPTRTLAVRLRAPNGGFAIEATAPETQWIDRAMMGGPGDGFAAWRWTITPERHGRNRLLLTVSARLIGADGLVAEAAPSDRSIEVKIAPNYRRLAQRWAGWLLAMLAGVALGQFGGEVWASLVFLIRQATGT